MKISVQKPAETLVWDRLGQQVDWFEYTAKCLGRRLSIPIEAQYLL